MNPQFEKLAQQQANHCRVFSNPTRIRILWTLRKEEMSVGAIAEAVGSSLQNVSQHLKFMKMRRVVTSRREGQTVYYRVDPAALESNCSGLLQAYLSRIQPYSS